MPRRDSHRTATPADWRITRSLPHGHLLALSAALESAELKSTIGTRSSRSRTLAIGTILHWVVARTLLTPADLQVETATSSLPWDLDLQGEPVSERDLEIAVELLASRRRRIEHKLAKRHIRRGDWAVAYILDLGAGAIRGLEPGLASGVCPQVHGAVVCSASGEPIALVPLDLDPTCRVTLPTQLVRVQRRFGLRTLLVAGTVKVLRASVVRRLSGVEGVEWAATYGKTQLRRLVERGAEWHLPEGEDVAELTSPLGGRVVVRRDPNTANRVQADRDRRLQATERALDAVVAATQRRRVPLRGRERIDASTKRALGSAGMATMFSVECTDSSMTYTRRPDMIAAAARLDGLEGVRTSVGDIDTLGATDALRLIDYSRALAWAMVEPSPPASTGEAVVRLIAAYLRWSLSKLLDGTGRPGPTGLLADLATLAKHLVVDSSGTSSFATTEPTATQRKALVRLGALPSDPSEARSEEPDPTGP